MAGVCGRMNPQCGLYLLAGTHNTANPLQLILQPGWAGWVWARASRELKVVGTALGMSQDVSAMGCPWWALLSVPPLCQHPPPSPGAQPEVTLNPDLYISF